MVYDDDEGAGDISTERIGVIDCWRRGVVGGPIDMANIGIEGGMN